jgi:hypothetical protein
MQCIITYTTGIRSYLKPVLRCKFVILDTYHPDTLYYVSNYARIRGYFSKPEGAREQESFEKHCSKWRLLCLLHQAVLPACLFNETAMLQHSSWTAK